MSTIQPVGGRNRMKSRQTTAKKIALLALGIIGLLAKGVAPIELSQFRGQSKCILSQYSTTILIWFALVAVSRCTAL